MKLLKRTALPVLGLLLLAACADSTPPAYTKTTTTTVERGSNQNMEGTRY